MAKYNKKIYKSYNFKTRRGVRRKWRQQKLAVGTVQNIAREIAKQEDNKNTLYGIHQVKILATPTSVWNGAFARPDLATRVELTPNSLYSQLITGASAEFLNPVAGGENTTSSLHLMSKTNLHVKTIQACLMFQNYSQNDQYIRVSIIACPRSDPSTPLPEPRPQDQPYTNIQYKGIFNKGIKSYTTPGGVPYQTANYVIATKRFKLSPTRSLYDVKGSTVTDEITVPIREITLTKTYKSRGKKLTYNTSAGVGQAADNLNFYLCVTSNNEDAGSFINVRMWGVAGFKYSLGQPTQKQPI